MTDAEFELELVEALNMLLEDERASVEMEVALASGATEYAERDTLTAMGAEDIRFCVQVREEMEDAGLPVTPQINGVVFEVIGAERYDDRLRAFAHHQRVVADRARELQESNLEGALRDALDGISMTHDLHADWIERRATEFAATRTLEFGVGARAGAAETREAAPAAPPAAESVEQQAEQIEQGEPVEPVEPVEPAEPAEPAEQIEPTEVPVIEPEPSPAPALEETAAPQATAPKPRTRAATRSTTTGSAKPGATRAKTPKATPKATTKATTRATTRKASTTTPKAPTRRTRRAPDAETPPDEA